MEKTIFHKILEGSIPSWKIWEDNNFLAFLTPFPIVDGQCVIIPKINQGDNLFELNDDQYINLLIATKKVALILKEAFKCEKVAMIVEGREVPFVHTKLYPLIRTDDFNIHSEGEKLESSKLDSVQKIIKDIQIK